MSAFEIARKRMRFWRLAIFLIVIVLISSCCIHIEPFHHGIIRDAETGEALKGVSVYFILTYRYMSIPESYTKLKDKRVVFSNTKGEYRFLPKVYLRMPIPLDMDKHFSLFKPGYFEAVDHSPESILPQVFTKHKEVTLYKMTHYLNYFRYRDSKYRTRVQPQEDIPNYQDRVTKTESIKLDPVDDIGVFMRVKGREFARMYGVKDISERHFQNMVYYVLDDVSGHWLSVDARGKLLDLQNSNLPKWGFMIGSWDNPIPSFIYSSKDTFFCPLGEYTYSRGWGEFKTVSAYKGNISAMAGVPGRFFTIEGDGSVLCHYGIRFKQGGEGEVPQLLGYYTVDSMPSTKEDRDPKDFKFKYLIRDLVVCKSRDFWHIYRFVWSYGQESRLSFKELASFPVEREITALESGWWGGLYIAFKGEGIRKYQTAYHNNSEDYFKEDTNFFARSKYSGPRNVRSMLFGHVGDVPVIYVTSGDEKIYRFSEDGEPDFIVDELADLD